MTRAACLLLLLFCGCNDRALGEPDGGTGADLAPVYGVGEVARLCLLAASCGAGMSPPQALSASNCTATVIGGVPDDRVATRFYRCAGATRCDALVGCLGSDLFLLHDFSPNSGCSGSSIVVAGRSYDCAGVGLTCAAEIIGERAYCADAVCGAMFTTSCSGDTLQRCDDNVLSTTDCNAVGASCVGGQCVGRGDACDPQRTDGSCSGTQATVCVGGRLATQDCARQPLRTQCLNGQCNVPPMNGDCLIGNASCNGTSAVICAGSGGWQTIDCRVLGFQGCGVLAGTGEVICR
jgi:hypothetical protein